MWYQLIAVHTPVYIFYTKYVILSDWTNISNVNFGNFCSKNDNIQPFKWFSFYRIFSVYTLSSNWKISVTWSAFPERSFSCLKVCSNQEPYGKLSVFRLFFPRLWQFFLSFSQFFCFLTFSRLYRSTWKMYKTDAW